MGDIGRCELIEGEIIPMAPAGAEHGDIALEIAYRIKTYVMAGNLGKTYGAETGFIIARNPDTIRAPDAGFVRRDRIPSGPTRGFFPGAPDLAVEVVSPSDRLTDISAKVEQWLAAGTSSVWVVDPPNETIDVFGAGGEVFRYRGADELRDERTLPGFVLKLDDLFKSAR